MVVEPVGDYFSIPTDQQLATKTWYDRYTQTNIMNDASPIAYDQFSSLSINQLLKNAGHKSEVTRHDQTAGAYGAFVSGVLDLTGMSQPLYIVSPNMTSFGTALGPRGEHTIMRKVSADADYGGFGGLMLDTLQNEQDYFVCGGLTLKRLKIKLVNNHGQPINLNGTDWSFSIVFQDLQ